MKAFLPIFLFTVLPVFGIQAQPEEEVHAQFTLHRLPSDFGLAGKQQPKFFPWSREFRVPHIPTRPTGRDFPAPEHRRIGNQKPPIPGT